MMCKNKSVTKSLLFIARIHDGRNFDQQNTHLQVSMKTHKR